MSKSNFFRWLKLRCNLNFPSNIELIKLPPHPHGVLLDVSTPDQSEKHISFWLQKGSVVELKWDGIMNVKLTILSQRDVTEHGAPLALEFKFQKAPSL